MSVRRFACAMVLMGIAAPAAAGERPTDPVAPDALSLLLQDRAATYGSNVALSLLPPRPDAEPLPNTLTRFEAMMVPARIALPATPGAEALSFTVAADPMGDAASPATAPFDARRAIADAMADHPRPFRRRTMFDAMLTFRLDGEEKTRSVTMGGIAGLVWGALPRR